MVEGEIGHVVCEHASEGVPGSQAQHAQADERESEMQAVRSKEQRSE